MLRLHNSPGCAVGAHFPWGHMLPKGVHSHRAQNPPSLPAAAKTLLHARRKHHASQHGHQPVPHGLQVLF